MDIVLITTGNRPALLEQSLDSLWVNAVDMSLHTVTIVFDLPELLDERPGGWMATEIYNARQFGASASRNIGAASIPKYRRQDHVMFLDDDVFMCKGWDTKLMELAKMLPPSIISSHAHPFNHGELHTFEREVGRSETYPWEAEYTVPLVISTVCMMMPWSLWDDVGYFTEPGGPGGSEDYDYCCRARDKGYNFAVTEPQCVIHTGLTSSSGKQIVGHPEMVEQNNRLIDLCGLQGKVQFG